MDILRQDRPLRLKILSLLLDPKWVAIYGHHVIRPEFFETEQEQAFCSAVLLFHDTYKRPPVDPEDVIELMDAVDGQDLVYEIFDEYASWDVALASDIIIQFAREQAVKLAILKSIDDVNRGNLQRPLQEMEKALKVGETLLMPGLDIVKDVDTWLYEYWEYKVRTPWIHVNSVLGGGLGASELGVLLAPTNVGKTLGLIDIGYSAASIGSGLNVVHFTHEQKQETVARRYAARMLFRFLKRGEDTEVYKKQFMTAAKKLMPGNIRIIGGTSKMRPSEIRSHLDRLKAEGFDFGLVIDDYADLLEPDIQRSDKRFELSDIYRELAAIGGDYDVPIWTASQSNRGSYSKELITPDDISEDIGKAQIADLIIAICQTKEEYDMDKCRLFLAKVRDGKKYYVFDAKYYGYAQAIITTGEAVKKKAVEV